MNVVYRYVRDRTERGLANSKSLRKCSVYAQNSLYRQMKSASTRIQNPSKQVITTKTKPMGIHAFKKQQRGRNYIARR